MSMWFSAKERLPRLIRKSVSLYQSDFVLCELKGASLPLVLRYTSAQYDRWNEKGGTSVDIKPSQVLSWTALPKVPSDPAVEKVAGDLSAESTLAISKLEEDLLEAKAQAQQSYSEGLDVGKLGRKKLEDEVTAQKLHVQQAYSKGRNGARRDVESIVPASFVGITLTDTLCNVKKELKKVQRLEEELAKQKEANSRANNAPKVEDDVWE